MTTKPICGIYEIRVKRWLRPDGVYVGQSVDVHRRWKQHLEALEDGEHTNSELQKAYEWHGAGALRFKIIEECRKPLLDSREDHWIARKGTYNKIWSDGRYIRTSQAPNSPIFIDLVCFLIGCAIAFAL